MRQKIGNTEAILFILIVMVNKILLNMPKEIIKQSRTGAPINIIFTGIIAVLLAIIICKLFKKFSNEDIIDIAEYLGKKPLKIILGTVFIVLFTIPTITCIYEFTNLLQGIYFPNSPVSLLLLFFLVSMAVANKKGFKAIAKANVIVVIFILISLIIILGGTVEDFNTTRLNPILGESVEKTFLEGAQNVFSYGGLIYLLFLVPFLKNKKDFTKIGIISIAISGIFLLFSALTLLMLFPFISDSEELMSMYLLTRCIQFGEFLQRTDAIFIFLWIISAFSYLSISLMFITNIFKKMTKCESTEIINYPFLGLFFGLLVLFENQSLFRFLETVIYKYLLLAVLGISLIILILANFKRKDYSK